VARNHEEGNSMQTRTLAAALLSAAVPAFAAAGCGGGAAASDTPLVDRQAAALKYVRCLKDHGINAEVTADGGIGVRFGAKPGRGSDKPPAGTDPGKKMLGPPPEMRRAEAACKKYSPKQGGTPQQRAAAQQKALADALTFARCMRAHGIHWPDPQASGDGGLVQAGPSGISPNDPALQRAMKACGGDRGPFRSAPAP
jgi:hypothetical protein